MTFKSTTLNTRCTGGLTAMSHLWSATSKTWVRRFGQFLWDFRNSSCRWRSNQPPWIPHWNRFGTESLHALIFRVEWSNSLCRSIGYGFRALRSQDRPVPRRYRSGGNCMGTAGVAIVCADFVPSLCLRINAYWIAVHFILEINTRLCLRVFCISFWKYTRRQGKSIPLCAPQCMCDIRFKN